MTRTGILAGGLALACVLGAATRPSLADGPKGTAVVKGKVVLDGEAKLKALPAMTADPVCAKANPKSVPDEATLVYKAEGNAVPFAFVYVKEVKDKYDAPANPAVLDQKGCVYHPHVFGMVAGQTLDIKSSDPTAHNVHALPKKNAQFNKAQPNPSTITLSGKDTFTRPEMGIKIKCDVHSWMSAWCHVMPHPFFDTTKSHYETDKKEERGTFAIKDLPAGEYEIVAWHETFGEVSQKVTVKDGETKEIQFTFKKPGAEAKPAAMIQPGRVITVASAVSEPSKPACHEKASSND